MIKRSVFFVFFLFVAGSVFPQWQLQNSQVSNFLTSAYFTSGIRGWACGGIFDSGGIILSTVDGGTTWNKQYSDSTTGLSALCFTSPTRGWAVGGNGGGVILTTKNAGLTWTNQVCRSPDLYSVSFVDSLQGWAVGYNRAIGSMVLHTGNGGLTWTIQYAQDTSGNAIYGGGLQAVYFITALQGWAGGSGGWIMTTTDGGVSWNSQNSGIKSDVTSLNFRSATQGWAAAGGILSTIDGGNTWGTQFLSQDSGFSSVYFVSANQGWAAGRGIVATPDSGNVWKPLISGTADSLSAVFFSSASEGWAVGANGTILHTSDGGSPASVHNYEILNGLQSEIYPNPMVGSSVITYFITQTTPVEIELFEMSGEKMETLVKETKSAGKYTVALNKQGYGSGMYFYRFQTNGGVLTRKVVIQ